MIIPCPAVQRTNRAIQTKKSSLLLASKTFINKSQLKITLRLLLTFKSDFHEIFLTHTKSTKNFFVLLRMQKLYKT